MNVLNYILSKKVSFIAYLFLFVSFHCLSDDRWSFNQDEIKAYNHIIALQFNMADTLISSSRPPALYLQNLRHSLKIIITEDPDLMENYNSKSGERMAQIEKLGGHSPFKEFYLSEIKLQSAFVHLKIGDNWTAAWEFRKAYKEIRKNTEEHPEFLPNYKSVGMIHIMLGSVPQKYHWILSLLGMEGSVEEGILEIQKVAGSKNIFHGEAEAIHYLLDAYLLNNTAVAATGFEKIYNSSSDNLLFGYLYMSLLMKDSQGQRALEIYNHLKTLQDGYFEFNLLNYSAGEICLQKGSYQRAEKLFKDFIANNKGLNFVKDAHYKLFLSYWLNNQNIKASEAYRKAKTAGDTNTEADKYASKILQQITYPNKTIMKIRLATDGGFFDIAETFVKKNFIASSKKDQVEFKYRKARLYHKTDRVDLAISLYLQTIKSSEGKPWYFAPNSCLQLGYIYNDQQQYEKARSYFNCVLAYGNHEYKTSLDNKARAALTRYQIDKPSH